MWCTQAHFIYDINDKIHESSRYQVLSGGGTSRVGSLKINGLAIIRIWIDMHKSIRAKPEPQPLYAVARQRRGYAMGG